jgi:hypothetical protein
LSHSYLKQESEAKRVEEMKHYLSFSIEALEYKLAKNTFSIKCAEQIKEEIKALNKQLKELR